MAFAIFHGLEVTGSICTQEKGIDKGVTLWGSL